MRVCTFIAADHPLPEASPEVEYPIHIDLDRGIVELWHVWMPKYYDERPVVRTVTLHISDLTAEDIRELDEAETWDSYGKEQPTYYCLKIVHG